MASTYRIPDEPLPSTLSKFAVNPIHPTLASMLAGQWLAWPWFIFNAIALGSPTKKTEIKTVVFGALAITLWSIVVLWIDTRTDLSDTMVRLLVLSIVVMKMTIMYRLHTLQSRTYELFEHFAPPDAKPKNALPVVLVGAFLLRGLVLGLFNNVLWRIVISGGLE